MGNMWHDIHTKFHKNSFRHSKFNRGDTQVDRHAETGKEEGDLISLLLCLQNEESRLRAME
jgi:hypothetical protein